MPFLCLSGPLYEPYLLMDAPINAVFSWVPLRPDTSKYCTSDDGNEVPMPGSVPVVLVAEAVPSAESDVLEYKGKAVGAIHNRLDFWIDNLFPDAYARGILLEGYKIPIDWSKIPEKPDNKSAKDKYEFMRSEVDRLVSPLAGRGVFPQAHV
jgi:hypothetical protein